MNDAKNVLAPFVLAFAGLKEGIHHFSLDITSTFFDAFDYTEFNDVALNAQIELNKKATLLELSFSISGTVNVSCDVSRVALFFDISKAKLMYLSLMTT